MHYFQVSFKLKVLFVDGQNNSKCCDVAPLMLQQFSEYDWLSALLGERSRGCPITYSYAITTYAISRYIFLMYSLQFLKLISLMEISNYCFVQN